MGRKKFDEGHIGTFDFETDPFEHGVVPKPFACGLMVGEEYKEWWGANCGQWLVDWMYDQKEPLLLYAHNGGKFDVHFLFEHLHVIDGTVNGYAPRIVNGRVLEMQVGKCTIRDSMGIFPFALSKLDKGQIDYMKMKSNVREQHKEEILVYLKRDCSSLLKHVLLFREEFGNGLTVGGVSMNELTKLCPWTNMPANQDAEFRRFYYGGRVECFEKGDIAGDFHVYDINSQYPTAMRDFTHPIGNKWVLGSGSRSFGPLTNFAVIDATSTGRFGCLPLKDDKGALTFPLGRHQYCATGHEIRTALELGLLKVHRYLQTYQTTHAQQGNFAAFVDHFYTKRDLLRAAGEDALALFYKYVLNSAYGKFGQNPNNWGEYFMTKDDGVVDGYTLDGTIPLLHGNLYMWKKPASRLEFNNVATAASITGAARSMILRGLAGADRPLYCDTDSIFCTALGPKAVIDSRKLGAYKCEADFDRIAIYGKKVYAALKDGIAVKTAHKGFRATAEDIFRAVHGEDFVYHQDSPSFSLAHDPRFISRRIKGRVGEESWAEKSRDEIAALMAE
jgi:hypothetical protein